MKKHLLLSAFVALMGFTSPLSAAEGDVVITVDLENGTLSRTDGKTNQTWNDTWTSTQENPTLRLTAPANNMAGSGTNLDLRSGQATSSVYTLSTTGSVYYISAYSFKATHTGTGTVTLTANGETTTLSTTAQLFERSLTEDEASQPITFTQAGDNTTVIYTEFTVTLSRHSTVVRFNAIKDAAQAQASSLLSSASGLWKQEEIDAFNSTTAEALNIEVDWSTVTDADAKLTEIENNLNSAISAAANEAYSHLHGRRYRFNSANSSYTGRYMQANADNALIAGTESTAPLSAIWQLQFTDEGNDCKTVRLYNPVRRQYINGTANRATLTDDKEQETTVFTLSFRPATKKLGFHSQPQNNYLNLNGSDNFNSFAWWNFDDGSSFTATIIEEDYTSQITDEMLATLSEIGDNHKATVEAQEPGDYLTADVATMKEAYADYATEANNNDAICIKFFYDTAIANRAWPCFQLVYYGNHVSTITPGTRAISDLGHADFAGHALVDKFDLRQAWVAEGCSSTSIETGTYQLLNLETERMMFHRAEDASYRYKIAAHPTAEYAEKGYKSVIWTKGNENFAINSDTNTTSGINMSTNGISIGNNVWDFVYLGTDKALSAAISTSEMWRSDEKAETRTQFAEAKELAHPTDKSFGTRLGQYNREGLADDVAEFDRLSSSIIEFNFDEFATLYTSLSSNAPTLNMPADGTYFTVRSCVEGEPKLVYNTTADNAKMALSNDANVKADTMLYKNGSIISMKNGMHLTMNTHNSDRPRFANDASSNDAWNIHIEEGLYGHGSYKLWGQGSSKVRMFHVVDGPLVDCCDGDVNDTHNQTHSWYLTQVDTLTVNVIGDSDFGSFYCATPMTPVAVEGTVYYYGLNKLQNDTTEHREIVFTRLEPGTVVPEGYVVVFEAAGGYGKLRKPLAGESPIEADADHAFQGSHIARVHTATEGNITFAHVPAPAATEPAAAPKRVNVVAEEGTPHVANMTVYPVADSESLPANAMVVTLPKESNLIKKDGSATFSVGDQSKNQITTGLNRIVFDNGDGTCVIYDLQGRKLAAPVRGRVNIINGHKVYVK